MIRGLLISIALFSFGAWSIWGWETIIIGRQAWTMRVDGPPAVLLGASYIGFAATLASHYCPAIDRLGRNGQAIIAWIGLLALLLATPTFAAAILWVLFDLFQR